MRTLILSLLVSCFNTGLLAQEVRRVEMTDTSLVTINLQLHYSTMIVFPQGERFIEADAGDAYWKIDGPGKSMVHNFCSVRPARPAGKKLLRGNLNAITVDRNGTEHHYAFALHEIGADDEGRRDYKVFVDAPKQRALIASTEALLPDPRIKECDTEVMKAHQQIASLKDEIGEVKEDMAERVKPTEYVGK